MGSRHAQNLSSLGHSVIVVEPNSPNKEKSSLKYVTYSSINEIKEPIDIAFICTPTESHIPIAQTIVNKEGLKAIFIEKPLSWDLRGVRTLFTQCKENNIRFGSACNMLYLSGINLVKTLLNNNAIGTVYSASYFFGHNLAKWNDREYKTTYSAKEYGGILLDDSHSIYIIEDLFGGLLNITGSLHKSKLLEIINEDAFEIIGLTGKNILARIHGDYLASEYTRNMEIYGTEGILQWEMYKKDDGQIESYVNIKTPKIHEWRTFNVSESLNEMYIRELSDFISFVEGKKESFHNGVSEIDIITRIREKNK